MTHEPATPSPTPNPAALLSPDLIDALVALEHEMLRRAQDYEPPAADASRTGRSATGAVGAKNLSPRSGREPYHYDPEASPRSRRLARQARLKARRIERNAPRLASIPQPVSSDPGARTRRFDTDLRFLMRFCSIRKTILEANLLNPSADPLPDPGQFLPDNLVRALACVEQELGDHVRRWQDHGVRPGQLEFQLVLDDLCRAVAIRKTLLDLSRISPRAPEGFPGWNRDRDANPSDDPLPPIPPPNTPPPNTPPPPTARDLIQSALDHVAQRSIASAAAPASPVAQAFQPASSNFSPIRVDLCSSVVRNSSPLLPASSEPAGARAGVAEIEAGPAARHGSASSVAQAFQPAAPASNLRIQISNTSPLSSPSPIRVHSRLVAVRISPLAIRVLRALRALSRRMLRDARRYGDGFIYLRPIHVNPLILRFTAAVAFCIACADPQIPHPPPAADAGPPPGAFPDDAPGPDPPLLLRL